MSEVTFRGPLFDGRALSALGQFEAEAVREVAKRGEEIVDAELSQNLKNPTGHYQSQVKVTVDRGDSVVSDSGVIYGPWLEGTSSRNQTTRFKGYASFRKSAQKLKREAPAIANKALRKYVGRMG